MSSARLRTLYLATLAVGAASLALASGAAAAIDGLTGTSFSFHAKADNISTADGGSPYIWGYTTGTRAQYPGPTLIVDEGDVVTITLVNDLPGAATSIIFPGQTGVSATGGVSGLLTQEAPPDGTTAVTYTFTASNPGTYLYHSGTRPELQVELGLFGALIVRPAVGPTNRAYNHPDTQYDHEYLFLLSEMDPYIHFEMEKGGEAAVDGNRFANYVANYWYINGRAGPDTLAPANVSWLPTQPYNALVLMHPGDRVLMRFVSAGRELHPFHPHGNHVRVVARDGHLLESSPGTGADLSYQLFTVSPNPGSTVDAIFEWTGKGMGWDIYGTAADGLAHDCIDGDADTFDDLTHEYCPDHNKPFPVQLPDAIDMTFGGLYGGSPFLGALGSLPPGEGGLNPAGGFGFIWHSHTERELANFDIFPGGMLTMLIILPPSVPLP